MPVVAGYDPNPSDNLRVEVAFTTSPDDPSPAYVDLPRRLDLTSPVSITRGRGDEYSAIQPSTCSLTLDNTDGALTAGDSGSAFYPNVLPHRKIRVTYRNPDVGGNFLSEESAAFTGGTLGDWFALGTGTAAADTVRATSGAYSMRIDWAVTGGTSGRRVVVSGLTIGRAYTLSADMFIPAGGEAVSLNINGIGLGVQTSTTNAWARISTPFTATATTHTINVFQLSVGTAYSSWVDSIMVDEGTNTTFTMSAPPIEYRFTGYVEEWPCEWPGGNTYSQAQITAVDRLARIGAKRAMRSVIEEALLALDPAAYYPCGEPEESTKAGDIAGLGASPLSTTQYGAGGTIDFGTATGPPTDALPAPTFTPASSTNGLYLAGDIAPVGGVSNVTLRANFLTSAAARATIVRIRDEFGFHIELEVTAAGKLRAHQWSPWDAADTFTLTSAATVSDGLTHDAAVTLSVSGGTATVVLYLDGANAGSTTFSASLLKLFRSIRIGGTSDGNLFSGVICHVAAFNSALAAADVTEVYTATSTGFEGDTSDERIARYAAWAGIAAAEMDLDAGSSTSICFTDTTGQSVLQAMQDVAQTEGGRLFIDGAGLLVFHARSRTYDNPAATASVDAHLLGADARFSMSTQDLVNDVTGKRPTGPEVRAFDAASIATYGVAAQSTTLLVTSDTEVTDAVNWRVQGAKDPQVRLPSARFDLYTDTTGYQAQLRALELGDRVAVTGLPSQAPAASMDFIIEGYTESIGLTGWDLTANLSNYTAILSWVWDVSLWDDGSRWIY